jgi:hypothetical protein
MWNQAPTLPLDTTSHYCCVFSIVDVCTKTSACTHTSEPTYTSLHRENAVTSCLKCNGRKGSMPVADLRSIGMRLIREPRCPTQMELAAKAARMVPRRVHTTWKPFLGIAETPSSVAAASTSHKNKKSTVGSKRTGDEESIDDRYFVDDDETYYSDY